MASSCITPRSISSFQSEAVNVGLRYSSYAVSTIPQWPAVVISYDGSYMIPRSTLHFHHTFIYRT